MNKRFLTILYGVGAIAGGILLSMFAQIVHPIIPLILGIFFLPILSLTVFRQYSLPGSIFLGLGMCCATISFAPSVAWGILMAAIWYCGAMILRIGTTLTPDLFPLLLYGGSIYLGLITLGVALMVKDTYGVYDFKAVFDSAENLFRSAIAKVDQFYASASSPLEYEKLYQPMFEQLLAGADAFVYQAISFGLVFFGGWYFLTLKIAEQLCHTVERALIVIPLTLYGVPREIAWCYIPLFVISIFVGETYFYAFDIALTLTGFLFVPAGVGLVDGFMHKWPTALRRLLKILMLLSAFLGHFFGYGIAYTALMAGGLYISLFRQVIFRRKKGGPKDE